MRILALIIGCGRNCRQPFLGEGKSLFPISFQLWNNLNKGSLAPILIKGRIKRKITFCRQRQTLGNQGAQSQGSKFSRREIAPAENKTARLPKQMLVKTGFAGLRGDLVQEKARPARCQEAG
jgi:hypothetical protein